MRLTRDGSAIRHLAGMRTTRHVPVYQHDEQRHRRTRPCGPAPGFAGPTAWGMPLPPRWHRVTALPKPVTSPFPARNACQQQPPTASRPSPSLRSMGCLAPALRRRRRRQMTEPSTCACSNGVYRCRPTHPPPPRTTASARAFLARTTPTRRPLAGHCTYRKLTAAASLHPLFCTTCTETFHLNSPQPLPTLHPTQTTSSDQSIGAAPDKPVCPIQPAGGVAAAAAADSPSHVLHSSRRQTVRRERLLPFVFDGVFQ